MISQSASNVTLESFHFIGGEVVGQFTDPKQFLDLIQHNMPNLSDFRFSNDLTYDAYFFAYYLQFLGLKKSLKTAHFESRHGDKKDYYDPYNVNIIY